MTFDIVRAEATMIVAFLILILPIKISRSPLSMRKETDADLRGSGHIHFARLVRQLFGLV
jgi:hypothetical protein